MAEFRIRGQFRTGPWSIVRVLAGTMLALALSAGAPLAQEKAANAELAFMGASLNICGAPPASRADLASRLTAFGFLRDKTEWVFDDASGRASVFEYIEGKYVIVRYQPKMRREMPSALIAAMTEKARKVSLAAPSSLDFEFPLELAYSPTGTPMCSGQETVEVALSDGAWLVTSRWIEWK